MLGPQLPVVQVGVAAHPRRAVPWRPSAGGALPQSVSISCLVEIITSLRRRSRTASRRGAAFQSAEPARRRQAAQGGRASDSAYLSPPSDVTTWRDVRERLSEPADDRPMTVLIVRHPLIWRRRVESATRWLEQERIDDAEGLPAVS